MKFRFQPMNFEEAAFMVDAEDFDSAVNAVNISPRSYLLVPCSDEEADIIAPAVAAAKREGIDATGPVAADAVFLPHNRARFDGIVAMYHDQGHIAMKLLGGRRAVNVTAGLPIVRTSVAHGTAYDIAGKGLADPSSLVSAARVAARLAGRL